MRHAVMAAAFLAAAGGAAFAQEDRKVDELKREFERSMKGLQEKFEQERARLEKEFRAARDRMLERKGDAPEKKEPRGVEDLLREVLKRVESLEKRLDGELPRLRELPRALPKAFDFKRLPDGMPEEWRKWMEQMPKFKGAEDFKFDFKKSEKQGEEKPKPKKKKDDGQD